MELYTPTENLHLTYVERLLLPDVPALSQLNHLHLTYVERLLHVALYSCEFNRNLHLT